MEKKVYYSVGVEIPWACIIVCMKNQVEKTLMLFFYKYSNVMGYDTKDFLHCSFHFVFKLKKDELWAQYSRTKQVTLDDFIREHRDSQVVKFKPNAPVMVHCK